MMSSSNPLCVGVDVGGTNTDAVVLQHHRVVGWCKVPTSPDVTSGVKEAIDQALTKAAICLVQPSSSSQAAISEAKAAICRRVSRVNVGTTQFLNAVVQRRASDLERVAVIRLCHTNSLALPPFIGFPEGLAACMRAQPRCTYFARGGFEFNSQPIAELDSDELKEIGRELRENGVRHVVISGIFSSLHNCEVQEVEAGACVRSVYPEASITLSHMVGQMGLLERENAAIFNESLKSLCHRCVEAFSQALLDLQLQCPLYLSQNDGTLVSAADALALPVCTFSSGPTNSMAGAVFLSQLQNAIVVDVGGTTTDVGCVLNGFPRQASSEVKIAGVNINFRMPDVLSFGLGGGSLVREVQDSEGKAKVTVGRDSVGYRLTEEALVFGGQTHTATDIAVAAGLAPELAEEIGQETCQSRLSGLSSELVERAVNRVYEMVVEAVDFMKVSTAGKNVPVVLVGGGSILIDSRRLPPGVSKFIKPPHYQVANAVGAARGKVSGSVDTVVQLASNDDKERLESHEKVKALAKQRCIAAGAMAETVEVGEVDETAMSYLPGSNFRLRVRAVGDVNESQTVRLEQRQQGVGASEKSRAAARSQPSNENQQASTGADDWLEGLQEVPRDIDTATGDWNLSAWDIECITIGAGILGCGGGGSPALGRLRCLQQLKEGKKIRVISIARLGSCPELTGCVSNVGFMGAPTVSTEKLVAGSELLASVFAVQKLLAAAANPADHPEVVLLPKKDGVVEVGEGLDEVCKPSSMDGVSSLPAGSNVVALMSDEVGGLNCMEPLCVGASLGLPVVDCDGMGRAFPELQMFLPLIHGGNPCPCALVDASGKWKACVEVDSAKQLEDFMRLAVVQFGCVAALSFSPLSIETVRQSTIHESISRCCRIGEAVLHARKTSSDPVAAMLRCENARLLGAGKIIDRHISVTAGFARGHIKVEMFKGSAATRKGVHAIQVDIQNEFLCVHQLDQNLESCSRLLACVPHLISVLDCETGFPITTEELRPGQRVAVVVIHAPDELLTEKALPVVGPEYFMKNYGVTKPVFPLDDS